jgi:hypothetical protein
MSKKSNFSNAISINAIQSPQDLEAIFVYNKYENDEVASYLSSAYEADGKTFKKEISRYTIINFKQTYLTLGDSKDFNDAIENQSLIHNTDDFSQSLNSFVTFQDTGILSRNFESIDRSCRIRGITGNATDKAEELALQVGNAIDSNILQELSVNSNEVGMNFFNTSGNLKKEKFKNIDGIPISFLLIDNIASDVLSISEFETIKSANYGLLADYLKDRQQQARQISPYINSYDFSAVCKPYEVTYTDSPQIAEPKLVCHIIERIEEKSNGEREIISPLKILEANELTYKDFTVLYGAKYTYLVRSIYTVTCQMFLNENFVEGKILFSSNPSNLVSITAEDTSPPPPPEDLRFRYDYTKNEMTLSWSLPINKTQDITRFQVFRRNNLLEPFVLLKEYDFDQSIVKTQRNEEPLPINVIKTTTPVRRHTDYDFRRNSDYIYAVCSVDAHGYVSNYSAQHRVSFNKQKNSLSIECVSDSGAPRPYPNLYVNLPGTLTLDSITRSGIKKMSITFDPEYLKVTTSDGKDLNFLDTNNSKIFASIIDTTRAEQVSIPITINDLRSQE